METGIQEALEAEAGEKIERAGRAWGKGTSGEGRGGCGGGWRGEGEGGTKGRDLGEGLKAKS